LHTPLDTKGSPMSMDLTSVQKTLGIIKPDAVEEHTAVIREAIIRRGFTIVKEETMTLSPDTVRQFYSTAKTTPGYEAMCTHLASGPCHVMVLAKLNALADFVELVCGEGGLHQVYGTDDVKDAIYASPTRERAQKEIKFFFPQVSVDAIPTNKESRVFVQESLKPVLIKALTDLSKAKPEHPTKWLADYLLENNPNKPRMD